MKNIRFVIKHQFGFLHLVLFYHCTWFLYNLVLFLHTVPFNMYNSKSRIDSLALGSALSLYSILFFLRNQVPFYTNIHPNHMYICFSVQLVSFYLQLGLQYSYLIISFLVPFQLGFLHALGFIPLGLLYQIMNRT